MITDKKRMDFVEKYGPWIKDFTRPAIDRLIDEEETAELRDEKMKEKIKEEDGN